MSGYLVHGILSLLLALVIACSGQCLGYLLFEDSASQHQPWLRSGQLGSLRQEEGTEAGVASSQSSASEVFIEVGRRPFHLCRSGGEKGTLLTSGY